MTMESLANELNNSELYRFGDWPNKELPRIAAGVYSVYTADGEFIYVGMAGERLDAAKISRLTKEKNSNSGLIQRLKQHQSGQRSGDRFNIYICDLYVLCTLTTEQIELISKNELSLDLLTKEYVHRELYYRYLVTDNNIVRELEDYIKECGLDGNLPTINSF